MDIRHGGSRAAIKMRSSRPRFYPCSLPRSSNVQAPLFVARAEPPADQLYPRITLWSWSSSDRPETPFRPTGMFMKTGQPGVRSHRIRCRELLLQMALSNLVQ